MRFCECIFAAADLVRRAMPSNDCPDAARNGNAEGLPIPENQKISVFAPKTAAAVFQRQSIRVRCNFHPPKTGLQRPDPGDIFKNPGIYAAKGIVIIAGDPRLRAGCNGIPGFPNRGCSLLHLIQPGGHSGLPKQLYRQIPPSDLHEGIQQERGCQKSCVQTAMMAVKQ